MIILQIYDLRELFYNDYQLKVVDKQFQVQ